MNQDEEHLRLLSVFHYVCAGLAAFFACMPIFYFIMGLVLLLSPESFGPGKDEPPRWFGLFFAGCAAIMVLLGWAFAACLAYAGRCLGQRKNYTFCLVMAGIACIFMPFGTALGIFAIVVLSRPSVKALFATPLPPAFPK